MVLCHKSPAGGWSEKPVLAKELPDYLRYYYPKTDDVFITQNRFIERRRKIESLLQIDAIWSDIDYYKHPDLADLHPMLVLERALEILTREKIPEPTISISSGRGLYLIWLIEPIDAAEVVRWNRVQKKLQQVLSEIKSDSKSLPASQVLRLPGTRNTKNGRIVETISNGNTLWNFDDLYSEIIDESEPKPEIITPKKSVKNFTLEKTKRGGTFARRNWNAATLWAGRFYDLRTLKTHRWPNGIPEGYRDIFLYLSSVALSWIVEPGQIRPEITALARSCINWNDKETLYSMKNSIERSIQAAKGETIKWNGAEIDPRYRFKSKTITELLEVTSEEIRGLNLRYLITGEVRKERKAIAQHLKRIPPPIQGDTCATYQYKTRSEYTQNSLSQLEPWKSEGVSRRTWYRRQKAEKQKLKLGEQSFLTRL